jgi:hypothetical protein
MSILLFIFATSYIVCMYVYIYIYIYIYLTELITSCVDPDF